MLFICLIRNLPPKKVNATMLNIFPCGRLRKNRELEIDVARGRAAVAKNCAWNFFYKGFSQTGWIEKYVGFANCNSAEYWILPPRRPHRIFICGARLKKSKK